ncbi:unnamed protein product [Rotaria sp. Silwood2]|nr:unnamed protein product [Rotaria sp. Silwood2]CAF3383968.1 unnamed protein product [Rotaria sp. Silwood2]CAF4252012.1 unnamed protein product [Rotaria sp. Silwood2]
MEKLIELEYNRLYNENAKNLTDFMFSTRDTHATEYFTALKNLLEQLYTKPLPKTLETYARYSYKTIESMLRQLRQSNIAVGQTDKSKLFSLIDAQEYKEKIRKII